MPIWPASCSSGHAACPPVWDHFAPLHRYTVKELRISNNDWTSRQVEDESRPTSSSSSFLGNLFLLHPLMVMSSTPDKILVILPFSRSLSTFSLKTSPSAHRPFCFLLDNISKKQRRQARARLNRRSSFRLFHIREVQQHLLFNKVLLGPDDGPWSADPYPGDGLCRSQAIMFHHVATNQSAGPPKAGWNKNRIRLRRNRLIAQPQTRGRF